MDLNKLLFNHQIALMEIDPSGPDGPTGNRITHCAALLRTARHQLGVPQYAPLDTPMGDARPSLTHNEKDSPVIATVEARTTQDRGQGIFALRSFERGDVLYAGVLDNSPIANHSHASQISKTKFGFHTGFSSIFNHSCSPNCGIVINNSGAHNIVAMEAIPVGGEATYDYAMRNYRIEHFPGPCACGNANCRGNIDGWVGLPQQRRDDYAGFVAPYLLEMDADHARTERPVMDSARTLADFKTAIERM